MSEGDWVVVRNKTEPSRRFRLLQRPKDELNIEPPYELEDCPEKVVDTDLHKSISNKDSDGYGYLVGAPIRIPTREAHTAHTELEISDKIGGTVCFTTSDPSIPLLSSATPPASNLDISNPGEWPSMGVQGYVTPHLEAWSTVVKKPVLPSSVQRKDQVSIDIVIISPLSCNNVCVVCLVLRS